MSFNINDFRSHLVGEGARPNLFEVSFVSPGIPSPPASGLVVRATSIPASSIGVVTQFYFGREVKFSGNRTFGDWTVTIINDERFAWRNTMEAWMNAINQHRSNTMAYPMGSGTQPYAVNAYIYQYGKNGDIIKQYIMIGMFPREVSEIALAWDANDQIEEFQVTFAYQYWESVFPIPTTS